MHESISLFELNSRISKVLTSATGTQNVWVTAELSDVAVRRGHCYMELLQKDDNGTQVAKARGVIWASIYGQLSREFLAATGQPFATGIKLMVNSKENIHQGVGV
ncbi:MAG: exodeoxyribonuclease VII large subunit, partial [Muribaculaceae bacterium]|nr:exodeoxyribonuclease VII large subunit [Muribaculaceae bacterium]